MARPRHEQPTPGELEFLKILWERGGPTSVRDVLDIVNHDADPPRAYTSVMSLLNVMTEKGFLRRKPHGRAFLYEPVSPRESTLRSLLGETLKRVYDGSASLLVAHLLDQSHPTLDELDQIRGLLNDYESRRPNAAEEGRDSMQAVAIESLESLTSRLIGLGLLHGLWISLLVAAAVALAIQTRPRSSHQWRHGLLVIALATVSIAPMVVTMLHRAIDSRGEGVGDNRLLITLDSHSGDLDDLRGNGRQETTVPDAVWSRPSSPRLTVVSAALSISMDLIQRLLPFMLVFWGSGCPSPRVAPDDRSKCRAATMSRGPAGRADDSRADCASGTAGRSQDSPASNRPCRRVRALSVRAREACDLLACGLVDRLLA